MKSVILYRLYTTLREHQENCVFFDYFGILVQSILASICLSTLLIKRSIELPQRPLIIWFLDTLKQVIGQVTQHFTNIFVAERLGTANGLSCEWYLYNILSDATIGIFISWLLLRLISHLLADTALEYNSGDYGQNKDNSWRFKKFILQLVWWNLIVIITKIICIIFCYHTFVYFQIALGFFFKPLSYNPKLKLVIVMIGCPVLFNLMQFWLIDNIIKRKENIQSESDRSLYEESCIVEDDIESNKTKDNYY